MKDGKPVAAQHLGMPFGGAASGTAFHRLGAFLTAVVRRHAGVPLARYVDDFFTACRSDVSVSGTDILDVVAECLGLRCAPEKNESRQT